MSNNSNSSLLKGLIAYSIGVFGTMTYLTHRDGQEALRFYREHKKKGSSVPGLISTMRSENEAILYGMELKANQNLVDSVLFPFSWMEWTHARIIKAITPEND